MFSDTDFIDKKSTKKLQHKVFLSFSVVTILISILFIFEGYYASLEFGKEIENIQLHNNAIQIINKINKLTPNIDENDDEIINIVDEFHTQTKSAVVFLLNDKRIYSAKKFQSEQLNKVVNAVEQKSLKLNTSAMAHHDHYTNEYCEEDSCLIEVDGQIYNWMIHDSESFGNITLIQESNVIDSANTIVFPRMLTSSAVVIWIGLWASLAIAIFIAKMVNTSNTLRLYPLYHDLNTDLPNNKSLDQELNNINNNKNDLRHYNLLLISIDNLDTLEYSYGYTPKEQCFKTLANRLIDTQDKEFIGVFQNNTFYCLSHHLIDKKIQENLQTKIQHLCEPIFDDGLQFFPTISQAIIQFDTGTYTTHEIIGNAKFALNKAKNIRSRVYTYSSIEDEETKKVNELTHDLIHAIERKEFVLYYQPKIDLSNNTVNSVEALVRWQHPTRGLLYPVDFIDLIENSIIASKFTCHLIEIALAQSEVWLLAGLNLPIAVNVSPYDLEDDTLVNQITNLHENGTLRKNAIKIELTEIENSLDIEHLANMLNKLKDINVNCAIDDFGTGMGSLTYLKYIPISTVKIDRSFVMDMDTNLTSKAIVESTIKLANKLGCNVVAEGIENKKIAEQLTNIKCDLAQGYYFSKAITGHEIENYIANQQKQLPISDDYTI